MDDFIDILRRWEREVADPQIYDNMDLLFPGYGFRRVAAGSPKDRWASRLKIDLSEPKTPNREKTVVFASDFKFREQGDWDNPVSVIDKLMEDNSLQSVYEAYRYAASRLGLEVPSPAAASSRSRENERREKLLESLQEYFVWNLNNNSGEKCRQVRRYLAQRGYTLDWVEKIGFGFVPQWDRVEAHVTASRMGFTREELDAACKVRGEDGYTTVGTKHVLAIPYRCAGVIKGFLFRAVEPGVQPKYKANTGLDRKSSFFNLPKDRTPKKIVVVEGEMDALTASAAGIRNVVAIGGSDISGERKSQLLDAFSRNVDGIYLCLDLDPGKDGSPNRDKRFKAVRRSLHTIFDVNPDFNQVFVVRFPEVTDPDEYIRKYGAEAFRNLLRQAVPWWRYLSDFYSGGAK